MAGLFRKSPKPDLAKLDSQMALARSAMRDPYSADAIEFYRGTNESVRSMYGRADGTIDFRALVLELLEGAPTDDLEIFSEHLKRMDFTPEDAYEREFAKHWESRNETERSDELIKLVQFQNYTNSAEPSEPDQDLPYEFVVVSALLGAKVSSLAMAFDAEYGSDYSLRLAQDPEAFGFYESSSEGIADEHGSAEAESPTLVSGLVDDEELDEIFREGEVKLEREVASSLIDLKDAISAAGEPFDRYLQEREDSGDPMDAIDRALVGAALVLEAEVAQSELEIAGDIVLMSCIDAAMVFAYTLSRSFLRNDATAYADLVLRLSAPEAGVAALRSLQWVYATNFISCVVDVSDQVEVGEQIELLSTVSPPQAAQRGELENFVSEWGAAEEAMLLDSVDGSPPAELDDALAVVEKHAYFYFCDALNLGDDRPMYMSAGSGVVMDSLMGGYFQRLESSERLHELNPDATTGD